MEMVSWDLMGLSPLMPQPCGPAVGSIETEVSGATKSKSLPSPNGTAHTSQPCPRVHWFGDVGFSVLMLY